MHLSPVEHRDRWKDYGSIGLLILLAAVIFLLRNDAVPMQLWDESRNANNAFEMSRSGFSLVTHFDGMVDHWSTKPPLLIWLITACFRLGLPPLWAVRLPSIAAGIASVFVLFFAARNWLRDRTAGLLAALTLLASPLFVGWHTGRTGDYDSLVTFFTLAYSLAFWRYLEPERPRQSRWIFMAGAALALGMLTKGVGGALALPALLLYAMFQRKLLTILKDWRVWLSLVGALLVAGSYYLLREHFDPGYLAAVWRNEFTGRYLTVNEDHKGGPFYYIGVLAGRFEPGFVLLPLAVLPFLRADRLRRSMTLLCLLAPGVLLAVLTKSQTKIFWYLAPATPFLAMTVGIGLSDALAWLASRKPTQGALLQRRLAYLAVGAIFFAGNAASIYYYQVGVEKKLSRTYMEGRYGPFLEQVRQSQLTHDVLVLDEGTSVPMVDNQSGDFAHYSPEAIFYSKVEGVRGMRVRVAIPGGDLAPGTWVATCDPRAHSWLEDRYHVAVALQSGPWCALEQTQGSKVNVASSGQHPMPESMIAKH